MIISNILLWCLVIFLMFKSLACFKNNDKLKELVEELSDKVRTLEYAIDLEKDSDYFTIFRSGYINRQEKRIDTIQEWFFLLFDHLGIELVADRNKIIKRHLRKIKKTKGDKK